MSKVQVLITTMHRRGFDILREMNIQTDAVIANQAEEYLHELYQGNGFEAQMITTRTRGLSKNRNIAMAYLCGDAEYILFSDDDLVFYDGYEDMIVKEFELHPEAQAIKFGLNNVGKNRKTYLGTFSKFCRVTKRNMTASGVCAFCIKRAVLVKYNLHFNEYFGAGTENYCGEDTIFLQELLKKKVRMYRSTKVVADIDQDTTSWFDGDNKKLYTVRGMILAACYPRLARVLAIRSALKAVRRPENTFAFKNIVKAYFDGIRKFLSKP